MINSGTVVWRLKAIQGQGYNIGIIDAAQVTKMDCFYKKVAVSYSVLNFTGSAYHNKKKQSILKNYSLQYFTFPKMF